MYVGFPSPLIQNSPERTKGGGNLAQKSYGFLADSAIQSTGTAESEDELKWGNQPGARKRFQRFCTVNEINVIMDSVGLGWPGFSLGTFNFQFC